MNLAWEKTYPQILQHDATKGILGKDLLKRCKQARPALSGPLDQMPGYSGVEVYEHAFAQEYRWTAFVKTRTRAYLVSNPRSSSFGRIASEKLHKSPESSEYPVVPCRSMPPAASVYPAPTRALSSGVFAMIMAFRVVTGKCYAFPGGKPTLGKVNLVIVFVCKRRG